MIEQILQAYHLPIEYVVDKMILDKNTETMVRSHKEKYVFLIFGGFLQEDTLALYMLLFCRDYVLFFKLI